MYSHGSRSGGCQYSNWNLGLCAGEKTISMEVRPFCLRLFDVFSTFCNKSHQWFGRGWYDGCVSSWRWRQSRFGPRRKQRHATCSSCGYWTPCGRKMCGWCEGDGGRAQEHGSSGDGINKESCDVVASHPLFARPVQRDQRQVSRARSLGSGDLKGVNGGCGHAQKHSDASGTVRRNLLQALREATN